MSVETSRGRPASPGVAGYPDRHGEGWVTFAGVMLMLIGVINTIGGIAAIDDANFYSGNAHYQFADLNTYGWVILVTGIAQILAAFGVWSHNQFARWLGVAFAGLNGLGQLLMMPAFPLWSMTVFAIDVLIIYGLLAYGDREAA